MIVCKQAAATGRLRQPLSGQHTWGGPLEYKVVQVRVRQLPTVKLPDDLGQELEAAARDGWVVDHVVPIMAKGFFGGSYTDSLLVFLKRDQDQGRMPN